MELNSDKSAKENGMPMSLSLISQFCDSKLKELSEKPESESDANNKTASLFSTIFNGSSSYKPKRREHCSGSSIIIDDEPVINCSDHGDYDAQQLQIKRKIPLSKHIKPFKLSEFMTDDLCTDTNTNNDELSGYSFNTDVKNSNLFVKERLQSYLPALKRHVENGKWAHLDTFPSLEGLMPSSVSTDSKLDSGQVYNCNAYHFSYKWDCDQAFLISSTPELMVFYGIVNKPSSIQLPRLKKLFAHAGAASLPLQNMTMTRKKLFLQDGTGRIELNDLSSKLAFKDVVSGIPVAIIGKVSGARLHIEDVLFATPCSPEWPLPREDGIEMVFVSGLFLGSEEVGNLALDLLQDYLLGLAGSAQEQEEIVTPKARLFIVGNFISKSTKDKSSSLNNVTSICERNIEKLDNFLEPLVHRMEVFLIPGENDLTFTSTLPQPPIHSKLLPQSGVCRSLHRMSNPAKIQVSVSFSESNSPKSQSYSNCSVMLDSSYAELLRGDVDFIDLVLQSGKNVKQTMEYCDISCPIEMGKSLLKWAHLHPTFCDTNSALADNLFTLKGSSPHLAVIGNLSEFKTIEYNGTKIIGLPSFHKTNTAVVLTKHFDVIPLSFKLL